MLAQSKTKLFIACFVITSLCFSLYISEKYVRLGEQELKALNYEKALINYEKAGILNPFNALINIKKGGILEETGNDKKAIAEYRKALAKDSNRINVKAKLIELLIKNDMAEASAEYILSPTKSDSQEGYLITISKALFILDRKEESHIILDKLATDSSSIQESIYHFLEGDYELAKKELGNNIMDNVYANALLKDTDNPDFYKISVAEALNEINQPYFGKIILEDMLKEGKKYRDVYLYLGNSYLLQNNIPKAKENVEKAKAKDPIYGLTYYLLSQINFKENNIGDEQKNIELAKKFGYERTNP